MALTDYSIDTSGTPDQIRRRQAYADALMKQGSDYTPVQSWTQGAARLAQGLIGGYESGTADRDERAGKAAYQQRLSAALQGNNITPQSVVQIAGDPWATPATLGALSHAADTQRQGARDAVSDRHWQASYELQKRSADRADDKTPSGFVADPNNPGGYKAVPGGPADPAYIANAGKAKTAAPEGYQVNPDGSMGVIKGGPADPEVIAATAEAKQGGGMNDGAVDILGRRIAAGDTTALQNVGRGAQGSKNIERIQNRAAQILQQEEGLSPQDAAKRVIGNIQSVKASQVGQSAEARTGATREANLNLILKATDAAIPAALEQSDKVARTGWVPLNRVIQAGQVVTSDPELKKFGMANLQLAEHWARAMNPTGVMRESDRDKALGFLSTADSPQTYKAAVEQLRTQITRERDAVRGSIPETPQFKGGGAPASQGAQAAPAQAAPDPLGIR